MLKKKGRSISSIIRKFIFMIIMPTLGAWILYLFIMNSYFIDDTLKSRQAYMKNSVSQLNLSLTSLDNFLGSIKSSPDIVSYLDTYTSKRDLLYILVKSVRDYCDKLTSANASVHSFKIYSKRDTLLYSDPFYPYELLPLSDVKKEELESLPYKDYMLIVSANKNDKSRALPTVYIYDKVYSFSSYLPIGYVEVALNPDVLNEYLSQFTETSVLSDGDFFVYQDGKLIYEFPSAAIHRKEHLKYPLDISRTYKDTMRNQYTTVEYIDNLNMTLVTKGRLSDLLLTDDAAPIGLLILVILILFAFVLFFFINMMDLSKQLLWFSMHIQNSNPSNLTPYEDTPGKKRYYYNEIDVLIHSYNDLIKENTTLVSQVEMMELLNRDAKFQALQAQIHPHFLYGTLENIRMLALQNKDMEIASLVYSLSSIFRHALNFAAEGVKLKEELDIINHYMKIQKYRFGERLTYRELMGKDAKELLIPAFLIQPLVENAIVYGASNSLDPCIIMVSARIIGMDLLIRVENSGQPIDNKRLEEVNRLLDGSLTLKEFKGKHNGLALYNINERLKTFYRQNTSIRMTHEHNFTIVEIKIERMIEHV